MGADFQSGPPQLLRRANMAAVLDFAWDVETFTATEAIAATGLTRTTVLGLCDDLVELGWICELESVRVAGGSVKGRPARRYAFAPRAGYVLGIDAGQHRLTASIADLRGAVLGRTTRTLEPASADPKARLRSMHEAVGEALDGAGTHEDSVLVTVVGVPAPVDDRGRSPAGDGYWPRMNPGIVNGFARRGLRLIVDNDANLAAIAEGRIGAGVGASSFVTLLSGERFGAGLIVDGALLRGRHGGAGEMHVLDLVEGVGSADGLAAEARKWARDAVEAGEVPKRSALRRNLPAGPEFIDVVTAAQAGEKAAIAIVDRLADRLARVCAVLSGLLDVERIIIGGAIAAGSGPVIERATTILETYMHLPVPELTASTLGADSVNIGAVQQALSVVREDPLSFDLHRSPDIGHSVDDTPATTRAEA